MGMFHEVDGQTVWIGRKTYAKPDWPLADLERNMSFLIPMSDGVDATGRTEPVIRAYITRYANTTYTRYHVHQVEGGLLVIRSNKPHYRLSRLR